MTCPILQLFFPWLLSESCLPESGDHGTHPGTALGDAPAACQVPPGDALMQGWGRVVSWSLNGQLQVEDFLCRNKSTDSLRLNDHNPGQNVCCWVRCLLILHHFLAMVVKWHFSPGAKWEIFESNSKPLCVFVPVQILLGPEPHRFAYLREKNKILVT